jgi:hypothetical protein
MVRHVSDLSWRVSTVFGNPVRRSESTVTVDKAQGKVTRLMKRNMSNPESSGDDESFSEDVFDNTKWVKKLKLNYYKNIVRSYYFYSFSPNEVSQKQPRFFFSSEDVSN